MNNTRLYIAAVKAGFLIVAIGILLPDLYLQEFSQVNLKIAVSFLCIAQCISAVEGVVYYE